MNIYPSFENFDMATLSVRQMRNDAEFALVVRWTIVYFFMASYKYFVIWVFACVQDFIKNIILIFRNKKNNLM